MQRWSSQSIGFCRVSLALLGHIALPACAPPPAEPESPASEPEPAQDGEIPWTPGEEPQSTEATTREVSPEPDDPEVSHQYYDDDGVEQIDSGPRCTGKASPELRQAVSARIEQTAACPSQAPEGGVGVSGTIKLSLKVTGDGTVVGSQVLADSVGIDAVTSCVSKIFEEPFSTSPPHGDCVRVVVPLQFEAGEAQGDEATQSD